MQSAGFNSSGAMIMTRHTLVLYTCRQIANIILHDIASIYLYKSKCKQNHNPCKYNICPLGAVVMKFYMFRPHCPRFQPRTRTQSSAGSALASGIHRDSNCCDSVGQRSQFGPLLGSVVDGKKEFSISREARFSHVLSSTFV